jgi:hypothetical protein
MQLLQRFCETQWHPNVPIPLQVDGKQMATSWHISDGLSKLTMSAAKLVMEKQ